MKIKLYVIMDQHDIYGIGQTVGSAIREATYWIINPETGLRDLATDQVEAMIISKHESRKGRKGIFVDSYDFDLSENANEQEVINILNYMDDIDPGEEVRFNYDLERMKKSLSGESSKPPVGLSPQEFRKWMSLKRQEK